jgi:hypothetical protein
MSYPFRALFTVLSGKDTPKPQKASVLSIQDSEAVFHTFPPFRVEAGVRRPLPKGF